VLVKERTSGGVTTVHLEWSIGERWGGPITHYTIEAATNYNEKWVLWKDSEYNYCSVNKELFFNVHLYLK
jgi:hypothetical protein